MSPEEKKAKRAEYQRNYVARHKEAVLARRKAYREKNKEILSIKNKEWTLANRPALIRGPYGSPRTTYLEEHGFSSGTQAEVRNFTRKKRYAADPNYKARQRIHSDMWKITRGVLKGGRMFALLGCTLDELSAHIEAQFVEGMSFDNLGEWEVDHIKQLSSFDLTDEAQLREACHYSNTRPLWRQENRSRGE